MFLETRLNKMRCMFSGHINYAKFERKQNRPKFHNRPHMVVGNNQTYRTLTSKIPNKSNKRNRAKTMSHKSRLSVWYKRPHNFPAGVYARFFLSQGSCRLEHVRYFTYPYHSVSYTTMYLILTLRYIIIKIGALEVPT